MKAIITQVKKELRKQVKLSGAHTGYLRQYVKTHFPSIEENSLNEFIDTIVAKKYATAKAGGRKLRF